VVVHSPPLGQFEALEYPTKVSSAFCAPGAHGPQNMVVFYHVAPPLLMGVEKQLIRFSCFKVKIRCHTSFWRILVK
jgi:hypothetical protein